MRKHLAIVGLSAAGLVGGGAAGFALTGTTPLAGAERASTAATSSTTVPTDQGTASGNPGRTDGARPDPSARLQEVLAPLVEDGTLTQAQADKVVAALKAAAPTGEGRGHGGRHGGPGLDAAATAIGITADELRTALQGGTSIAAVAKQKNVEVTTVVDAMVAEMKTHIAQEVTDGRITQAEADQRLSDATERITAMVNGQMPAGGRGPGFGDHDHDGRPGMPGTDSPTTTQG